MPAQTHTCTHFAVIGHGEHGLLATDDLYGVELREALAEARDLDLVPLDTSPLPTMVVAPAKDGEGVAQRDAPVLWVPVGRRRRRRRRRRACLVLT